VAAAAPFFVDLAGGDAALGLSNASDCVKMTTGTVIGGGHMLETGSLAQQVYDEILDEICAGTFPTDCRLKQEALAWQMGVSRQPVQQALSQLKADGVVHDAPGRGLAVAGPNLEMVRHRCQVRIVLDCMAAEMAAARCANDAALAQRTNLEGLDILDRAMVALEAGDLKELWLADVDFHDLVYRVSGNPALKASADVHWRYLQRIMSITLREVEQVPDKFWKQHSGILESVTSGQGREANRWARVHIRHFMAVAQRAFGNTAEKQLEH